MTKPINYQAELYRLCLQQLAKDQATRAAATKQQGKR